MLRAVVGRGPLPLTQSNIDGCLSFTPENRPKYPFVKVTIMGAFGSFHPAVAAVQTAMRQAGIPMQELGAFYEDAADCDEINPLLTASAGWTSSDDLRSTVRQILLRV